MQLEGFSNAVLLHCGFQRSGPNACLNNLNMPLQHITSKILFPLVALFMNLETHPDLV